MRQRIADFSRAMGGLPEGARLLDFGCGSGDITCALAAEGFAMAGIDLSPAMVATARQRPGAQAIDWLVAQAGSVALPFAEEAFDGALASSVLEYHADPAAQMVEIARVLKPGGLFAFTVPDMDHPVRHKEEKWRAFATGRLWPLLRLTPRHDYFEYLRVSVNRWPLEEWLAAAGSAGFVTQPPASRSAALAMIMAQKAA